MSDAPAGAATRGLSAAEARTRLERIGPNEVPEPRDHPLARFARKFWGLSAGMIEAIAVLSFLLGRTADLWIAVALLVVNAALGFLQERRASAAVAMLRRDLRVTARVLRDGTWSRVSAREIVEGDVVRVRGGDFVPADARILDGVLRVDQSALTGESREIDLSAGGALFSGAVVRNGEATAVVVATGVRTYFGRTTHLVATAAPKLHVAEVIDRVVAGLFAIVGALVGVVIVVSLAGGRGLIDVLPLSLVLLMSAVPVALPVMFTVASALGSVELSRRGVLVVHLNAAEDAATMDVLCADKTGTLTANDVALAGLLAASGFTEDDVVRDGARASSEADQDPIDAAFLGAVRKRNLVSGDARTVSFTPFSAATRRTESVVESDGRTVRFVKGALRTVAEAAGLDAAALASLESRAGEEAERGARVIAVARGDADGPLRFVGLAFLHDAPRPNSRRLLDELRGLGVSVKMLTGDALPVARAIAGELALGEIVRAPELRAAGAGATELVSRAGGFAEVFPEDKFLVVKGLQEAGHVVGMTGDGVNDAPALRQAEVGIAVKSATDVAKAAANVVLTTDGLVGIVDMVRVGRAIYQRVLTWIVNKVSRTVLKAGFVVVALLVTGRFVVSALGMVLLVFMTDFVKIALATDRVHASEKPETWRIGPLVKVAVVLGLAMLAEALGLLAALWRPFGLAADEGRLYAFTFELLFSFALLSIVSLRERRAFWRSRPSAALAAALAADACVGVLIGLHGVGDLRPLPPSWIALAFGFAAICTLGVNDAVKTALTARALRVPRPRGPQAAAPVRRID